MGLGNHYYLIKKQSFVYNQEECLLVLLRDVSAFQLLQEEKHKVSMMKLLHAAVSHDLMHPINNIEFFVDEMIHECRNGNFEKASQYQQYILDSCKLASCRMQDLLDQNLIEHKAFVPRKVEFSPHAAITRIKNLFDA